MSFDVLLLVNEKMGKDMHASKRWSGLAGLGVLVLSGCALLTVKHDREPASLVLDGATIVDVEQGRLDLDQRVIIVGNRIQAVGGARSVALPPGAVVVEAKGKYLIPGLWDMHVHANRSATDTFYPLLLANGVTGIRDPGSSVPLDTLMLWRREILAGTRVGPPRQILSGQYITEAGRNGMPVPCNRSTQKHVATCVSSPDDARHLVDSLKTAGADMIKSHDASPEVYFSIASEARRIGIPFGGHLDESVAIADASDSGVRIIDHRGAGGRSHGIDSICLERAASVTRCQSMAERFRQNNSWWVPTLIEVGPVGPASWSIRDSVKSFSQRFGRSNDGSHDGRAPSLVAVNADSFYGSTVSPLKPLFRIMHAVDFPMLAGTDVGASPDLLPGFSLHGELAAYVAEGLTPLQALQTATINPAKMWHGTDSLGAIAAGKLADLVLLDANPLADITNTTTIRAVIANGRYYDRAALDTILAGIQARVP